MAADVQIRFKADSSEARAEIDLLRKEIGYLREGFKRTQAAATVGNNALARFRGETIAATHVFVRSIDDFGGALNQFDRRFLGFHERVDAFTGAIHRLPPEITAVRDAFDVLAPTAARVESVFADIQLSLVDTESEALAFRNVFSLLSHDLTSFAADQAIATAEIKRVNPAISAAVRSLRDYNDVMSEGIVNFREVVDISKDVTASVRTQASAFDALRRSVDGVSESQSRLQGQQLGSGIFDSFNPQTPGSRSFSDDFGSTLSTVNLKLGEELVSQAISTTAELQRIERDRIESLTDLERAYSEKILAINEVKRQKLAEIEQAIEAERVRRLASIQEAFDDAKEAEISARQETADRILKIEQDAADARNRLGVQLNQSIFALEQEREARIRELNAGLVERARERQQEILAITERATQARAEAEQRYADRVQEINNRLVEQVRDIQRGLQAEIESLESGFVVRQAERADEIVRITQAAADDRAAANRSFTDTMEGIYTDLVTAWDALEEGFTERQADRAQERIAIERRAADARVAANEGYADRLARISTDLVDEVRRIEAEIVNVERQAVAERQQIEEEALEARFDANAEYAQQIQEIEADTTAAREAHHQRLLEIEQRAIDARLDAERSLSEKIQDIQNDLVDTVRRIQDEIQDVEAQAIADRQQIEEEALEARFDANAEYAQQIQEIEADTVAAREAHHQRLLEIEQRAIDARLDAERSLSEKIQDIQNDLVDEVTDIQEGLNETLNDLRDEALDAERDRQQNLVDLHEETQQKLEDLERARHRTEEDLRTELRQDQLDAAIQLDRDLQEADSDGEREEAIQRYNRRVYDLNQEFHRDILDLRKQQQRQQEDLARQAAARELQIAEQAQARQAEITQQRAGATSEAQEGIADAESAAGIAFQDAQANYVPVLSAHEQALVAHTAALEKINQDAATATETADQALATAVQEGFDAAAVAATTLSEALDAVTAAAMGQLTALGTDTSTTITGLEGQITAAETRAGLTIEQAQANYVPALSAHEQALREHTAALNRINQESAAATEAVNQARSEAIQAGLDEAAVAATALSETLTAVTSAEQERLGALGTETSSALAGLQGERSAAETRTGLTFDEALANYTPAVDLNTQALQALTAALDAADIERHSALGTLDATGRADRFTTQTAQRELAVGAGVSIEEARANFAPALSSAAQATLTLNATMQALDTSFREAISEIQETGLVDQQATDAAIQEAVSNAIAQQTLLETQAGTTFADASLAFQPGLSDISQAGFDRDTTLGDISQSETEEIDALNAQSIADRLETDAAITETRDAFLKASAQETLKYQTEVRQINNKMLLDIRAVKETLKVTLGSIDDKLDTELAEIREQKAVFDTRIGELIEAINAEGNLSFAELKEDTAAMRSSLEAIAEEARDNAWKDAILKVANVGITIAGVAAGTALGNPVAGLAVGQAVGGLVEQGGQELFHFESTDAIAHRMARSAAFRRPRPAPNYLPTPDQLRNARDVGREVVAGFTEGLSQRNSGFGNVGASQQSGFPEEITATLEIVFPDGTVQELRDQIIRLEAQDR